MNRSEIKEYLYKHIPVTKALGVEPIEFSRDSVKFSAPLSNNINHRSSAFGGSISSLLITTCWSYLRLLFDDVKPTPKIVIAGSSTKFLKPIVSDFIAELRLPNEEELQSFMETFERFGKARITLSAVIQENDKMFAVFEGDFVVLK